MLFQHSTISFPTPTLSQPGTLQKRLIVYFTMGILASIAAFLTQYYFNVLLQPEKFSFPSLEKNLKATLFMVPALFICGLLGSLLVQKSQKVLTVLDAVISALVLLALGFIVAVLFPGRGFMYPFLALLLFHALWVPSSAWIQAWLGVVTLASFAVQRIFSFQLLSETQRIMLTDQSGKDFWKIFGVEMAYLFGMVALSIAVARSLSKYRRALCDEKRFGNYVLKKYLGTGGMGKVYLATHTGICRPTALKVLTPKEEDLEVAVARFEREVKLCATLTHPNTVTVFDYGRCEDNTFYYAMEYLEGLDLQRMVEKFGPMPANRALHALKQISSALIEAHQKGIVHRDIKPSNIFLSQIGGIYDFVKILDFGLAKETAPKQQQVTASNIFIGTPAFVAPEMILDPKRVDARTDIYMLGCTAYWLLTGHAPFEGGSDTKILVEHVQSFPPWLSEKTEMEIPDQLERIVMKCLEKRMEDRFQSMVEVKVAVDSILVDPEWSEQDARSWWLQRTQDELRSTGQREFTPSELEAMQPKSPQIAS